MFPKNVPLCDCLYFCQILTDFQFFSDAFCGQLSTKPLLNTLPQVDCVVTLPCEIKMQEQLTITDSKRVGKQNILPTKKCGEWSVRCYTLLDPYLWISGVFNDMFVSGFYALVAYHKFHNDHVFSAHYIRQFHLLLFTNIGSKCKTK